MPSNTNYDTALKKVQYTKDHFDKYKRDLKSAFRLHPDKLDTVMLSGTMNPVVKRTLEDKYKSIRNSDGTARLLTDDQVNARIAEDLVEFKKEVAAAIILTIPDETLAQTLEDKAGDDGHKMFKELESRHSNSGNATRLETIDSELDDHCAAGLTSLTLDAFTKFCDRFENLNVKLSGTGDHRSNAKY